MEDFITGVFIFLMVVLILGAAFSTESPQVCDYLVDNGKIVLSNCQ